MQYLHPNSTLQGGKYRIEKVLGQGGFGITYLAEHTMLRRKVAIKEFFMKKYCVRQDETIVMTDTTQDGSGIVTQLKTKFIKEARILATLSHPNIVRIYDIFEENDTAYYVMEYIKGESLAEFIKKNKDSFYTVVNLS